MAVVEAADGGRNCTHEVACPPGAQGRAEAAPPPLGAPAREFPFSLDPFQRRATECLEAGDSVLVAAHTSAGKTVIAQYCFAMALRDKQRVIYTSPLKALSNQKYREFQEDSADVGLLTGDVTINPHATCLVMTTEILRHMLYNGSEVVRQAGLLVFDEVHYIRDKERGVVWEECIILAPKQARFAFLSATVPNAMEFAQWVATTHGAPVHIVYTDFRPTPLQHYIFPAGGAGLHLTVDERGGFHERNFQGAMAALAPGGGPGQGRRDGARGGKGSQDVGAGQSDIFKIVCMLMEREYDPVILFNFSKDECEALAVQLAPLDLNTPEEHALVDSIYGSAVECLSPEDRRLPFVTKLLPMLRRGVGVHHSGLLPVLKEVTEVLFSEGLLKVLVATETFSTGLNMPAKTVVFTSARKYDGGAFRWLSSGEYIQMSGRAGRRGLDARGIVVLMVDARMEAGVARGMVQGAADALRSEFALGWGQLLNLLKSAEVEPEALLAASFRQFQARKALPALLSRHQALQEERDAVHIEDEEAVRAFAALCEQSLALRAQLRGWVCQPASALPFLQPGRLIRVLSGGAGRQAAGPPGDAEAGPRSVADRSTEASVWGVIVNFERCGDGRGDPDPEGATPGKRRKRSRRFVVDVLAAVRQGPGQWGHGSRQPQLCPSGALGEGVAAAVVATPLEDLVALGSVRINLPPDLRPQAARTTTLKVLAEVEGRYPQGLPLLDPEEDMGITDLSFRKCGRKLEGVEKALESHPLAAHPDLPQRLALLDRKQALDAAAQAAGRDASAAAGLVLKPELKARRRVLQRLGFVDKEGLVTAKGRVAAEIRSADELLLTEMLFTGAFTGMKAEVAAALLSCLVWQERTKAEAARMPAALEQPLAGLRALARRLGKVQADAKLPVDPEEYAAALRPDLAEAVAAWAAGAKFADAWKLSGTYEGSFVRILRRLEELGRQLVAGARLMGDSDLVDLFTDVVTKLKRDVVFAPSLYL